MSTTSLKSMNREDMDFIQAHTEVCTLLGQQRTQVFPGSYSEGDFQLSNETLFPSFFYSPNARADSCKPSINN